MTAFVDSARLISETRVADRTAAVPRDDSDTAFVDAARGNARAYIG